MLTLEESAEDLYENAPCGYLSTQPGGTIVRVNRTFLDWTGYAREDLVGRKRLYDLLPPGGKIYYETHYAPLLQMQGAVREIAVELICAGGKRLPVLLNAALRRDEAGKPLLVRVTVFNATDRKEYERELLRARQRAEQADQAKASFLAVLSHEIRNPLNAIMAAGYLLESTPLNAEQQQVVKLLRSSSRNLLNLINNILDFSKIESGKETLAERPFDLPGLARDVLTSLQAQAEAKGLELASSIDPDIPPVLLGDPLKIGQVLTNLIGNAIKFTNEGHVELSIVLRERNANQVAVEIRVTDTGIGIAPERLPRIFDDFTQANYDIGMKYGGSGLGLAISQKIVEMHGSRIRVESEPGRGSTFYFTLRLAIALEDVPSPAP